MADKLTSNQLRAAYARYATKYSIPLAIVRAQSSHQRAAVAEYLAAQPPKKTKGR